MARATSPQRRHCQVPSKSSSPKEHIEVSEFNTLFVIVPTLMTPLMCFNYLDRAHFDRCHGVVILTWRDGPIGSCVRMNKFYPSILRDTRLRLNSRNRHRHVHSIRDLPKHRMLRPARRKPVQLLIVLSSGARTQSILHTKVRRHRVPKCTATLMKNCEPPELGAPMRVCEKSSGTRMRAVH